MALSLFHYGAFVILLWRLRYFVMAPSLFRYGAFVMSPRNNEKTKWQKSSTIKRGMNKAQSQEEITNTVMEKNYQKSKL